MPHRVLTPLWTDIASKLVPDHPLQKEIWQRKKTGQKLLYFPFLQKFRTTWEAKFQHNATQFDLTHILWLFILLVKVEGKAKIKQINQRYFIIATYPFRQIVIFSENHWYQQICILQLGTNNYLHFLANFKFPICTGW